MQTKLTLRLEDFRSLSISLPLPYLILVPVDTIRS